MRIYRLRDDIEEGVKDGREEGTKDGLGKGMQDELEKKRGGDFDESNVGEYRITDLKQGVKNPNRVNVFIDGKYAFSLDVTQVVDYKLRVGKVISLEERNQLKEASEFGKLYQRTLEWVLMRPRSIRETRDYLMNKYRKTSVEALYLSRRSDSSEVEKVGIQSSITKGVTMKAQKPLSEYSKMIETIIERLLLKGYLDDKRFAKYYVENRFVKKGISQKRLRMELMKKGVDKETIDEVLGERSDEEEIDKIIMKKKGRYDDKKLMSYLVRQGFSYELVRERIESCEETREL